jgi:uncharacterized iron-regulated protein
LIRSAGLSESEAMGACLLRAVEGLAFHLRKSDAFSLLFSAANAARVGERKTAGPHNKPRSRNSLQPTSSMHSSCSPKVPSMRRSRSPAFRLLPALLALAMPCPAVFAAEADTACLEPGRWTTIDVKGAQPGADIAALIRTMAQRDVVLLGEQHDQADHHRWQVQMLAALHAQRPGMLIGFEMFPRRAQPVLDRWVAGELSEREFLKQVEWDRIWSMPAELYLPLFHFARLNRVPMVALNIDQKLSRAVAKGGWGAVPEAEREGVGRAVAPSPAYVDFLFEIHREHAHMRDPKAKDVSREDAAFRNFVDSQLTWDRAMAEALVSAAGSGTATSGKTNYADDGRAPLVVGIMGSGHVRFGHGVAHQLKALAVAEPGLLLPVDAATPCTEMVAGLADAVFAVPEAAHSPAPPPRLGVSLEEHRDGVKIVEVTAGSLAAHTGLRAGDLIVEAAGGPLKRSATLIALVQAQTPGTWLPLKLKRDGETIERVVRFPVRR